MRWRASPMIQAVMEAGEIRQDGPPESVYRSPANLFVAGFIGRLNRLDTPVEGGAAGVRPEDVRLVAGGAEEMRVPGRVTLCSYLGGHYELRCEVGASDRPWTVYSERAIAVGEDVTLHVRTQDLIVTGADADAVPVG